MSCAARSEADTDKYGLPTVDLRAYGAVDIDETIDGIMAQAPADLLDFEYDGFPFGRLCAFDLVVTKKCDSPEQLNRLHRETWMAYIHSAVKGYMLLDQLCAAVPVKRIIRFEEYSLPLMTRFVAEKHGFPAYALTVGNHLSGDRRRYVIHDSTSYAFLRGVAAAWPQWRDLALTPSQVQEVSQGLLVNMSGRGSHIYSDGKSTGADLRTELGLSTSKKILVAYTSSRDEYTGAEFAGRFRGIIFDQTSAFETQIDWLQHLVDFVRDRDDIQLVVRVHPREGKRGQRGPSNHLAELREKFDKPLPNCLFIWPESKVSSYDLAEITDLAVTSWSSIAMELSRLGVPVLRSMMKQRLVVDDFMEFADTPAEFSAAIPELIHRQVTQEQIARAYRFYNLHFIELGLDLGDVIPAVDCSELPPFKMPAEGHYVEQAVAGGKTVLQRNCEKQSDRQTPHSGQEEIEELQRQQVRIICYLLTGDADDHSVAIKSVEDGVIIFDHQGQQKTKYSPMVARLSRLNQQADIHDAAFPRSA